MVGSGGDAGAFGAEAAMSELHEHYRHSIEAANTRFAALVEHSFDVMAITTSEGLITYISPASTTMFGLRPDELTGAHLADRVHPDDVRRVRRWWRRLAAGELDVASFTCRMWHTQLGWRHIEQTVTSYLSDSHVGGLVANARDVTDQVDTHARLEHQTLHDALTGLPNRAFFLDRLERTIAGDTQDAESAVLVIDLDLFKQINDTFGYTIGDRVLITTAERIRAVLRTTDNVARLESDEFAVLADCVDGRTGATKIADRIAAAVSAPITIDGQSVSVGCSIGLAIPRAGDQPEAVLNAADLTMHQAKERGRNRIEIDDQDLHTRTRQRLEIEQTLRWALRHDGVHLVYQPIIDLDTGFMSGVEALVRVRNNAGDTLTPEQVIPIAEDSGLIVPSGEAILDAACAQHEHWLAANHPIDRIAVNVSARQLESPTFVGRLTAIFADHHVQPDRICLEITESTLITRGSPAHHNITAVKDVGVQLALDDFGTGWASLAHLSQLPFDAIKLDARFISGLGTSRTDDEVVKAVIGLGRSLGMTVIAEGVETTQQENMLRQFGCRYAQGFRFARPVPGEQLAAMTQLLRP